MMIELTETEIVASILDILPKRFKNTRVARSNSGRRGGVAFGLGAGSADIIGVTHGYFLAVEVKKPSDKHIKMELETLKNKKTDEAQRVYKQALWLKEMRDCGGIAFFATSAHDACEKLVQCLELRGL